ncbi:aminodeoxychorismate synthase component I [Candidatus Woesearchaeota archaeon]|nr:aminodeoxychorismate synthase component I [Candidatus Woesearchaeota archaeon]
MRKDLEIKIKDVELFKKKLLIFGNKYQDFVLLDSNNFTSRNTQQTYYEYDFIAGVGIKSELTEKTDFNDLSNFNKKINDWKFGFLTYDLKNKIEKLESKNLDELLFPNIHFFVPEIVILSKKAKVSVLYFENQYKESEIQNIIHLIETEDLSVFDTKNPSINLKKRFNKKEYIETIKNLKKHNQNGDIYEINFCHEFYSKSSIEPIFTYIRLNEVSPTPFSCFYKFDDKYLISASPERFLKKNNNKVISQPIKGTIRKGSNKKEDEKLKEKLFNDPKERAENVMIVDLVRNDLSRTAKKGSVKVEELYGIYAFSQVFQMISTISSEVEQDIDIVDIIKNAFPMGSMTGAPKVRAMQIIEEFEKTKRGLYSGAVGYISPDNDFDFNVVIRSILYNQTRNYVSFTVGGAITSLADPEKEYEECMLKAEAMLRVLK